MSLDGNKQGRDGLEEALTMAAVLIVLVAVAVFVVPNLIPRRVHRHHPSCINQLRQIDGAKQQWALENNVTNEAAVPAWSDIKVYLGRGREGTILYCPAKGIYTIGALSNAPTCSISGHLLP